LEYLKIIQCDIGQGYYFSRPVEMEEIEKKHLNK
jgi:EAL domain-containing protein (putative c-di-GMP-specific phosphodiesterase class I)